MRKLLSLLTTSGLALGLAFTVTAGPSKAGSKQTAQTHLKIGGATCSASCAKLSKTVQSLPGVQKQEFCTKSHTASITYNPSKVSKRQIIAAIRKAGYKVEGEQVELKVEGMMCGACSGKVARALGGVQGILAKEVSLEKKTAKVTFDPDKVSEKQIIAAIDRTGFKVQR